MVLRLTLKGLPVEPLSGEMLLIAERELFV